MSRKQKCKIGIHVWKKASFLRSLQYGLVKISESECIYCGTKRHGNTNQKQ